MYDNLSKFTRELISFNDAQDVYKPENNYHGIKPEKIVMHKGHQKAPEYMKLERDIYFDKDIAVTLRDNTTIYIDVYRPTDEGQYPVILASSMFGKQWDGMGSIRKFPNNAGAKLEWLSGYQTWEAPDPFYWCNHGYAVAYMDVRGTQGSEGNACYFGSQDAQDNYDVIEFLGTREWSNGKVAMGGNSWLAITQWYVASLNPPHLAAICPWEGHGNMYDDEYVPGGIPNWGGARPVMSFGLNKQEDLRAMMRRFPFMNEYWDDKYAKFENVQVPAYVVASYSSGHSKGTFEGFRRISSKDKWLRVHNNVEWPDLYDPQNTEDMLKFLDHFLKGIDNGWEKTPRVRTCILNNGGEDILNRPEENFPFERSVNKKLYLNAANGKLEENNQEETTVVDYDPNPEKTVVLAGVPRFKTELEDLGIDYDPEDPGFLSFTYTFDKDTEISGYSKVKLWMQAEGHNDMDVYVKVTKLDEKGEIQYHYISIGKFVGPGGRLRASLRELDVEKSTENEPVHPYRTPAYLEPEDIVPLEIGIWPTAMLFKKGETLCITVAGYDYMGMIPWAAETVNFNRGRHKLYTGGKYDSYLVFPETPEK